MILFPFVLLLGLIVGGWAPKEELRTIKKEMKDLQKRVDSGDKENRVNAFTRMMRIPDRATKVRPAAEDTPVSAEVAAVSNGVAVSVGAASDTTNRTERGAGRRRRQEMSPEDLKARIDEAKELWKTRVEIARAQWQNRLKFNEEQAIMFDEAINTMNERLYYAAQDFADVLSVSDSLTPEDTTRAVNEMTSVLTETYNEFHEIVADEQRGEVSLIELTDFIDPGVAEPLIPVQDRLDNAAAGRRPPSGEGR